MSTTTLESIMEMLVGLKEGLGAIDERLVLLEEPSKRRRLSSSSSSSSPTATVVDRFQDTFTDTIELLKLSIRIKGQFKRDGDDDGALATMEAAWTNKTLARVYFNVGVRMRCPLGGNHIIVPGNELPGVCTQVFFVPAKHGPNFLIGCASHRSFRCDAKMDYNGENIQRSFTIADPEKLKALVTDV